MKKSTGLRSCIGADSVPALIVLAAVVFLLLALAATGVSCWFEHRYAPGPLTRQGATAPVAECPRAALAFVRHVRPRPPFCRASAEEVGGICPNRIKEALSLLEACSNGELADRDAERFIAEIAAAGCREESQPIEL